MNYDNITTINQIHKRLNENGYRISKRLLRRLVDDGQIPSIRSGNRALVNYDSAVEYLLTLTAVPQHTAISA